MAWGTKSGSAFCANPDISTQCWIVKTFWVYFYRGSPMVELVDHTTNIEGYPFTFWTTEPITSNRGKLSLFPLIPDVYGKRPGVVGHIKHASIFHRPCFHFLTSWTDQLKTGRALHRYALVSSASRRDLKTGAVPVFGLTLEKSFAVREKQRIGSLSSSIL